MISPIKLWRNQKYLRQLLGKRGVIESFTMVRVPLQGFETQAPYPVVLVNFGYKKYIGQLVDADITQIQIGQKVEAVIRKTKEAHPEGVIPYGIKFKITA